MANYSRRYREKTNSTGADEAPLLLLEISHPNLATPARVVNDNDDFPYGAASLWKASIAYALNAIAIPSEYNGHYYKCTVAGTSGATEPAWPTTSGGTVVDGTVTWQEAGAQFKAVGFRATLPDDLEKSLPSAQLAIDNIGRELTQWIESSAGGRGATVRMMTVLRSDPDTIEWETTLDLNNVGMTTQEVTGTLGYEDFLNKTGVPYVYDPTTAPGLF